MHRVLEIPELVSLILSYLSFKELQSIVTTSQFIANISLKLIWEEVKHPARIMAAISPDSLAKYTTRYVLLPRPAPRTKDFHRFLQVYSPHIRRLTISSSSSSAAWADYQQYCPHGLHLFPNLSTLTWTLSGLGSDHLHVPRFLMHTELIEFIVSVPYLRADHDVRSVWDPFTVGTFKLRRLRLTVSGTVPQDQYDGSDLADVFHHCPDLEEVVLLRHLVSVSSLAALSHLKGLHTFHIASFRNDQPAELFIPSVSLGTFGYPPFHSLQNLEIPLQDDRMLFLIFPFTQLRKLSIHIEALSQFDVPRIVETCTKLTELTIYSYEPCDEAFPYEADKGSGFSTIKPLFDSDLSLQLKKLSISHTYPLQLTLQNLNYLSTRLPLIEELQLCPDPTFSAIDLGSFEHLDYSAFATLSKNCPNLRVLGVFISPLEIIPSSILLASLPPFRHLNRLKVPLQRMAEASAPLDIALFLSKICPPDCQIEGVYDDDQDYDIPRLFEVFARQRAQAEIALAVQRVQAETVLEKSRREIRELNEEIFRLKSMGGKC